MIFLVNSVARGSPDSAPSEREVVGNVHDSEDDRPVSRAADFAQPRKSASHGRFYHHHLTPEAPSLLGFSLRQHPLLILPPHRISLFLLSGHPVARL